jgi:hypothetical protein
MVVVVIGMAAIVRDLAVTSIDFCLSFATFNRLHRRSSLIRDSGPLARIGTTTAIAPCRARGHCPMVTISSSGLRTRGRRSRRVALPQSSDPCAPSATHFIDSTSLVRCSR